MSVITPIYLLLTFFLGASLHLTTVSEAISWEQLRDVQFKKKWYPEEGVVMLYPHFGNSVKALAGKSIRIAPQKKQVDALTKEV